MEKLMSEVQALFAVKELSVSVNANNVEFILQSRGKYPTPALKVVVSKDADGDYLIWESYVVPQGFLHLMSYYFDYDMCYVVGSDYGYNVMLLSYVQHAGDDRLSAQSVAVNMLSSLYEKLRDMELLQASLLCDPTEWPNHVLYDGKVYHIDYTDVGLVDVCMSEISLYLPMDTALEVVPGLGRSYSWKLHPAISGSDDVCVLHIHRLAKVSEVDKILEDIHERIFG